MSCCGNRRAALTLHSQPTSAAGPATHISGVTGQASGRPVVAEVHFQYTGGTALSVRGVFSQHTYRFAATGAVLPVDGRDALSFAAVPHLRRVRAPE